MLRSVIAFQKRVRSLNANRRFCSARTQICHSKRYCKHIYSAGELRSTSVMKKHCSESGKLRYVLRPPLRRLRLSPLLLTPSYSWPPLNHLQHKHAFPSCRRHSGVPKYNPPELLPRSSSIIFELNFGLRLSTKVFSATSRPRYTRSRTAKNLSTL